MALTVDRIIDLFQSAGSRPRHGKLVSAQHHALQCGMLADAEGAPPALVVAALLHDLGEVLVEQLGDRFVFQDNLHEYRALPFLRSLYPAEVVEPIRLHVMAKRFLCSTDERYGETLTPASRASLDRQGGPLSPGEAQGFLTEQFAAQALRLLGWDDQAHSPTHATPGWWYFRPLLIGLTQRSPELLAA